MSELRAKANGMAKEVASVVKGQRGIFARLSRDHGEVASLLDQGVMTSNAQRRAVIVESIRVQLLSHSRAEEETLYAALKGSAAARERIEDSRTDHARIIELIHQAASSLGGDQQNRANLERLRDAVERHVAHEEKELFPLAQQLITDDFAARLGDRFVELKEAEQRRLESDGHGWASGPIAGSSER